MGKVACSINLNKISKDKIRVVTLKDGTTAKFYDFDVVEKKEEDKWGKTHFVAEALSKEERQLDPKPDTIYIGQGKVFNWDNSANQQAAAPVVKTAQQIQDDIDEDELPF